MKFRPSQDRILVKRLAAEEQTPGGILIPETHRERPNWGEIVSLGTGRKLEDGRTIPIAFEKGDHVLFGRFSGTEIKINGVEYTILREDEVLGSVRNDDA